RLSVGLADAPRRTTFVPEAREIGRFRAAEGAFQAPDPESDGFDPILIIRWGALSVFLDAPPSLTGESDVPLGRRVEPNAVYAYPLSDDVVSVGAHGSFGRVWVDAFFAANVYPILPLPAGRSV